MKIYLRSLAVFLFILLLNSYSFAEDTSLWPKKIKVGGEIRTRIESQFNYDFNESKRDSDTFYLLRTRVYLDINPNENLQFFGMFQDSETFDQDSALVKVPDRHQFYQGYVMFQDKNSTLSTRVKVGRQELVYGDQRLIGNFGWSNLGRYFDGLVIRLENKFFWADLIGVRIPTPTTENQLAGVYGHLKKIGNAEIEPYVLYLHSDHGGLNGNNLNLITFGSRVVGKFLKNYDYGAEFAYQTGHSDGDLISAFALHSRMGYTFPVSFKPRLGLEYNFASGDSSPKTGKVTTFNNLFPTNHDKYGYMDFFSWKNLHDLRFGVSAQPLSFLKASLDYHAFLLPDPAGGLFMASGAVLRPGTPTASHFAGQEIDLLLKFEPIKYFDAMVGYSLFLPGSFFKDTGSSDKAHFFYTQLTARY
ncbi:MAG: alginate export family protein [Deltaproteobacteria bacterium]|nr:alginate export family protein [Deltaproteobacteria bacterium]